MSGIPYIKLTSIPAISSRAKKLGNLQFYDLNKDALTSIPAISSPARKLGNLQFYDSNKDALLNFANGK